MRTEQVKSNLAPWLFFGTLTVLSLVIAILVFQVALRYSYETDQTFGHSIRVDRLTGERCFASGSDQILDQLDLSRCAP
jgi:uncharacterized membrane protein